MEKLVVTWGDGDYDSYYEACICLEYASAAAFYIDLENKIKEFLGRWKVTKEFQDRWEENYPKQVSFNHKTKWVEAINKFVKENPRPEMCWNINDEIEISGIKFNARSFIDESKIKMPQIQTLDEWFQEKLKEN